MHAKLNKKIEKSVGKPNTLGVKGLKDKFFKFSPKSASFFYLHKNANLSNKTLILLVIFCKTRAGHTQQQSRQSDKVKSCCLLYYPQMSKLHFDSEGRTFFVFQRVTVARICCCVAACCNVKKMLRAQLGQKSKNKNKPNEKKLT